MDKNEIAQEMQRATQSLSAMAPGDILKPAGAESPRLTDQEIDFTLLILLEGLRRNRPHAAEIKKLLQR